MKIGSTPSTPLPAAEATATGAARKNAGATPAGAVATDHVDVSSAGSAMSTLDGGGGDFDAKKVESIRQAIREGRFSVNAEAIADRLIAEATALLGPRTH